MPPNKDNIETVIGNALALLESDKTVSPALRAVIALLIEFVKVLSQRQSLNSRNSSKPPASDPNRDKGKQKKPPKRKPGGQRGRLKRSKSRNLLERLRTYEDDLLRFMTRHDIPYTNNRGENDLRMTRVQQKISDCFRSYDGAKIFCRIRGYSSSCRKQGLTATDALKLALEGEMPEGFWAE